LTDRGSVASSPREEDGTRERDDPRFFEFGQIGDIIVRPMTFRKISKRGDGVVDRSVLADGAR